jgi:Ca2+-binding EF-hand superfamily protein
VPSGLVDWMVYLLIYLLLYLLCQLLTTFGFILQESVPQSLKDKILKEVDINQDGVIDYEEFLQLGKARGMHFAFN